MKKFEDHAVPASTMAGSSPRHLQLNVTAGCTFRLSEIADLLNMSAIRVGQALDALRLRDLTGPTQEAFDRGLGHRWYNGRKYLVDWHIAGITEEVTTYYNFTSWPSIPKSKGKNPLPVRRVDGEHWV